MPEDHAELKRQLQRTRAELRILYEISNAMRSTLDLNELLYMILTAITFRKGLGFNRAMLFLHDEKKNTINGIMAIGASTAEEASRIWNELWEYDSTIEDLIDSAHAWETKVDRPLNELVTKTSLPLNDESGIIAQTCIEGLPFEITTPEKRKRLKDATLDTLKCDLFVSVPLYTRTRVLGTILADNLFRKGESAITKDDVRLLMMLANQAGRAIDNSRTYEATVLLSMTDSLSGLWNHAALQTRLREALDEARVTKQKVSALMIDIDHFKLYNDREGHAAGDKVIRSVAAVLRNHTREEDTAARYGGEEFTAVLIGADRDTAYRAAERIRKAIQKRKFPGEKNQPEGEITVSVGTATFPDDATKKNDLLRKADNALYEAKRKGRNRTRATR